MNNFKRMMVVCSVAVLAMAGCDLINPPKKAMKPKPASAVSAPAAKAVEAAKPVEAVKTNVQAALPAGVLATVGEWTITEKEFNERIKGVQETVKDFDPKDIGARGMLLNELIRQQLLIQQARKELQGQLETLARLEEFSRFADVDWMSLARGIAVLAGERARLEAAYGPEDDWVRACRAQGTDPAGIPLDDGPVGSGEATP